MPEYKFLKMIWLKLHIKLKKWIRAISFKKSQLKLFIPDKSEILSDINESVQVSKTWFRYPSHETDKKIDLRYDLWYYN